MAKRIKILTWTYSENYGYAFAPIGMFCNQKLQNAHKEDVLVYNDWGEIKKVIFIRKTKIRVADGIFDFLVKSIFGEQADWEWLNKVWTIDCVREGLGREAYSVKEILLLEVKPY